MVHHLVLFKLKPEVTNEKVETMMMSTRMMLLKIPEALSVKCGKTIEKADWSFFIAIDAENMDKLSMFLDNSIHLKFVEDIIKPNTTERLSLNYEMEPGKEVKYS